MSIKKRFVTEYKDTFNMNFLNQFRNINFTGVDEHYYLSVFDIHYQIKNVRVTNTTIDSNQTDIGFQQGDGGLFKVKLVGVSMNMKFDYMIDTLPELVNEFGVGMGALRNLTIEVTAAPRVVNKFFQFDLKDINIQVEDFQLTLLGGDLSIAFNAVFESVKEFVKEYLLGTMGEQTKNALEGVVNELLVTVPRNVKVSDGQLEVDYGLVEDGIVVTDEYLSVLMDGTFHPVHQEEP